MSWSEIVRTLWPIMATITPFVLAGGFAWLKTQFPTKADLEKLRTAREEAVAKLSGDMTKELAEMRLHTMAISDRQIASERDMRALQKDLDGEPSRVGLSKDIGKVAERVGRLESGIDGLSQQLNTHNSYLQTLIERHL